MASGVLIWTFESCASDIAVGARQRAKLVCQVQTSQKVDPITGAPLEH